MTGTTLRYGLQYRSPYTFFASLRSHLKFLDAGEASTGGYVESMMHDSHAHNLVAGMCNEHVHLPSCDGCSKLRDERCG